MLYGHLIAYKEFVYSGDLFNENGKLILRNCFANGKFEQEKFN